MENLRPVFGGCANDRNGMAPAEAGAGPELQCRVLQPLAPWIIWQKWEMALTSKSNGLAVSSSWSATDWGHA